MKYWRVIQPWFSLILGVFSIVNFAVERKRGVLKRWLLRTQLVCGIIMVIFGLLLLVEMYWI